MLQKESHPIVWLIFGGSQCFKIIYEVGFSFLCTCNFTKLRKMAFILQNYPVKNAIAKKQKCSRNDLTQLCVYLLSYVIMVPPQRFRFVSRLELKCSWLSPVTHWFRNQIFFFLNQSFSRNNFVDW